MSKVGILSAFLLLFAVGCSKSAADWTEKEKALIHGGNDVMRVLTIDNPEDTAVLRGSASWLSTDDILSKEYSRLAGKMISTVTSPEQDGVGIAGPQVGISRRIVAVQRVDKEGEPFEVYPNISIVGTRGDKVSGPEGCLSVPGKRGEVSRYRDIDIKYTSTESLRDTVEHIEGFTAVIFQHEIDHLVGIIYSDKADSVTIEE
ncbi:MAG: peptide deformylase [Bacteroidales bacterium]|nr:peptide deformylase [Bacteroidales bacterium]